MTSILTDVLRDVRYAVRQLARTPGFTLVAILTVGLGTGASSAIFSVVNGVLLRPLPYQNPDTLVRVHEIVPQYGRFSVAPASFLDWRHQNTVFERIAAFTSSTATFTDASGPERITGAVVSADLFELLGVAPALGRSFRAEEDAPGKDTVIVLGGPGTVGHTQRDARDDRRRDASRVLLSAGRRVLETHRAQSREGHPWGALSRSDRTNQAGRVAAAGGR